MEPGFSNFMMLRSNTFARRHVFAEYAGVYQAVTHVWCHALSHVWCQAVSHVWCQVVTHVWLCFAEVCRGGG